MNKNLEDRIGTAYTAHANNQRDEAERQYRAILMEYPGQVDTLYLLSSLLLPLRPDEADALARDAVVAAGNADGIGVTRAALLEHAAATARAAGRPPAEEIDALRQAIDGAGPTPQRMLHLADALRRADRMQEAIDETRSGRLTTTRAATSGPCCSPPDVRRRRRLRSAT